MTTHPDRQPGLQAHAGRPAAGTGPRIAIAQIAMHWTVSENLAAMDRAMALAHAHGALVCGFSELAVTGFHRQIAREARQDLVAPALAALQAQAARLSMAITVGAPTFGDGGTRFITQWLIDEQGRPVAAVCKQGLTDAEATFFARGATRPIGLLQGLRCSAVICREVSDLAQVSAELPAGSVDLIFVPGALRQDPTLPRTDPPEYVHDILRLARATRAWVVQTNWPNVLNRPEESFECGGSTVASPDGELMFRLPMQACGVAVFTLGEDRFDWFAETGAGVPAPVES
jgi:omega-amidase